MAEANEEYKPGDLVYLSRSLVHGPEELLTILWRIDPEEDEPDKMPKYLTRTSTHAKKVVFHCEVILAKQYREEVIQPKNHTTTFSGDQDEPPRALEAEGRSF